MPLGVMLQQVNFWSIVGFLPDKFRGYSQLVVYLFGEVECAILVSQANGTAKQDGHRFVRWD